MNNIRINPFGAIFLSFVVVCLYFYYFGNPFNFKKEESKIFSKFLLSISIDLAQKAGRSVKNIRNEALLNTIVKGKTKEGMSELLTKADIESHKIIYNGLKNFVPGLNIISEEHDESKDGNIYAPNKNHPLLSDFESNEYFELSDLTVWIDPLDATQEYSENLTDYVSVMVCVAVKGVPVIGVIHRPFNGETVWGYVNHGTSKLKAPAKSNKSTVVVSRSHAGKVKEMLHDKLPKTNIDILPAGGAGYKFLEVLNDRAVAYVHLTAIKLWDVCAPDAIARAFKYCTFTTLKQNQLKYSHKDPVKNVDGIIASCTPEGSKLVDMIVDTKLS